MTTWIVLAATVGIGFGAAIVIGLAALIHFSEGDRA